VYELEQGLVYSQSLLPRYSCSHCCATYSGSSPTFNPEAGVKYKATRTCERTQESVTNRFTSVLMQESIANGCASVRIQNSVEKGSTSGPPTCKARHGLAQYVSPFLSLYLFVFLSSLPFLFHYFSHSFRSATPDFS
jgi:hypothetical protein